MPGRSEVKGQAAQECGLALLQDGRLLSGLLSTLLYHDGVLGSILDQRTRDGVRFPIVNLCQLLNIRRHTVFVDRRLTQVWRVWFR